MNSANDEVKYRLVMVRHGQSVWNLENRFTGWTDVSLTETGEDEAESAGRLLAETGWKFGVVHTSVLIRAIRTAQIALAAMGAEWLPVFRHWRLNERHYGDLQGLNKKETAEKHGAEQVHQWRRSYDVPPPPLAADDERHPRHDSRYVQLAPELIPDSECLADVVDRILPYWYEHLVPCLRAGITPLVVAHGNSMRALVKHLDNIPQTQIPTLNIPTGIPLVYELSKELIPLKHYYLGDPEKAQKAAEEVARQAG